MQINKGEGESTRPKKVRVRKPRISKPAVREPRQAMEAKPPREYNASMSAASGDMCINFEEGKAPHVKEVIADILCKEDMPVLSHLPDRLQTNTGYVLDDSRNAVMIERKQKLDAEEGMPFHQRVKLGQMKKGAEATNIKYDCDLVYHKFTSLVYLYELEADGSLGHLMAWVDGAWKRSMNFEQRGCKVYTPAKEDILLTGSEDDCVLAVYVVGNKRNQAFREMPRLFAKSLGNSGIFPIA